MASKIGESLRSSQEYPAKSVGKQGEEFLIATQVKSCRILYQELSNIGESRPRIITSFQLLATHLVLEARDGQPEDLEQRLQPAL
jgi:hypothetical protein